MLTKLSIGIDSDILQQYDQRMDHLKRVLFYENVTLDLKTDIVSSIDIAAILTDLEDFFKK